MKMTWESQDFLDFAKGLEDFVTFETTLMTATQNIMRVLHDEILKRTPVDTGNLRKMWSAGDNLLFTVDKVQGGYEVTIINKAINKRNLTEAYPNGYMYGVAVNDGHKTPTGGWIQGKFFVEASITQVTESKRLETIVYNELQKWWKSV